MHRVMTWLRTPRRLEALFYVLLIIPPISLAYYIARFGVNVIHYDEFATVVDLRKLMNGTLSLSDLFAQHNEHRILFPRIVILANAIMTRYNTVAEMYYSWLLISLTLVILFYVYRRDSANSTVKALLYFLPVSFMLFSFRQYESILWGFMLQLYLMIFCAISALFLLLEEKNNVRFGLSILSGFVASFSFATGLTVWPVGLLQMVLFRDRAIKLPKVVAWVTAGALTVILYFEGYISPNGHSALVGFVADPLSDVLYLLALIGAPFTESGRAAAITFGSVVALIAIITLVQARKEALLSKNRFWVSLILLFSLSALVVTYGRAEQGIAEALSSRYTPMAFVGLSGLYLLTVSVSRKLPAKRKSFGFHALLALLVIAIIVAAGLGWQAGQATRNSRLTESYILQTYTVQPDQRIAMYLYPNATFAREQAVFLKQNRLNVFSEPATNMSSLRLSSFAGLSELYARTLASFGLAISLEPATNVICRNSIWTI